MSTSGYTLIEVLVTLVLLNIVLLDFDATGLIETKLANKHWYTVIATHQLRALSVIYPSLNQENDQISFKNSWQKDSASMLPGLRYTINKAEYQLCWQSTRDTHSECISTLNKV